MGIPQIRVNPVSNSVLTLNGQPVSIYIDMQPASEEQMNALRPEDVKKVEYLIYPADPRYQHNPYVINYTLRRYEMGGYAKFTGRGNILAGSGSGLAYGKVAYKRMTYDLIVSDKYTDRHNQGTDRKQVFRFPVADGSFNEIVRENLMKYSRLQQNNLGISFRAVYGTDKISIANTFSLDATNRPCRVQQQMQIYATLSKKRFFGVSKSIFSRGRRLSFFCISIIRLSEKSSKLDFLEIYFRMSLLAFSMAPFCHEQ